MGKVKAAPKIPTVEEATGRVARAEQRWDRAQSALEAAQEGSGDAKRELSQARAALRAANRAQIDKHK